MRFYDILLWFLLVNVAISTVGTYAITEANIFNLSESEAESLLMELPIGNIQFIEVFQNGIMTMMTTDGIGDFVTSLLIFGGNVFISFGNLCISCLTGIPQLMMALKLPEIVIVLVNLPMYLVLFVSFLQLLSNRSIKYME